jgi:hypothetical protein
MLALACLNAGPFVGGDDKLILLQGAALPLAGIQIEHPARLGGKFRIAWKHPAASIPRPNSIFM